MLRWLNKSTSSSSSSSSSSSRAFSTDDNACYGKHPRRNKLEYCVSELLRWWVR
jgi:hypothetical protein